MTGVLRSTWFDELDGLTPQLLTHDIWCALFMIAALLILRRAPEQR